jgi:DNA-binding response OmpR family regulator
VLNLGGYDVLAKPFAAREVLRVVALAWRCWNDRLGRVIRLEHAEAAGR